MKNIVKNVLSIALASAFLLSFSACSDSKDSKTIRVGASPAPHAEILENCKDALSAKGYTLEIVEFTDCCIFNTADGLQLGDVILEIDDEKIYSTGNISLVLGLNPTGVHDISVRRGDRVLEFTDYPMTHTHENEDGTTYTHYGFAFGAAKDANFGEKVDYIRDACVDNVRMVRLSLQMLVTGQAGIQDMMGPVGLVSEMTQVANEAETTGIAISRLFSISAFIAINLAVMNLLPIPALDGGRAVCLLLTTAVESITRKKINPKYEGYLHAVGMILLMGLMAVILFKDIFVLIRG